MKEDNEDDESLDLGTEMLIAKYTERAVRRSSVPFTAGNLLRPIARALGRMGAQLGVKVHELLLAVTAEYEGFVEFSEQALHQQAGEPITLEERKPPKRAEPPQAIPILGPYYVMEVPADVASKLTEAGLIELCGDGRHGHACTPDNAGPREHERARLRIQHFIMGLRN